MPDAAFYLWATTPIDDAAFARRLYARRTSTVLPGSFIAREAHGVNPGRDRVRIALVAETEASAPKASRAIVAFARRAARATARRASRAPG